MTERDASSVSRTANSLVIGPSAVVWDGTSLLMQLREMSAPLPAKIVGTVRVWPDDWSCVSFDLDPARGAHRWTPIAPRTRVEVRLTDPAVSWNGWGYLDSNAGSEPLQQAFSHWHWSRSHLASGQSAIFYDLSLSNGQLVQNELWFGKRDPSPERPRIEPTRLPSTGFWRIARQTWADAGSPVSIFRTLEDTPFYARSLLRLNLHGTSTTTVHESLHLRRLSAPGVRLMLPFKMPRRPRRLALR